MDRLRIQVQRIFRDTVKDRSKWKDERKNMIESKYNAKTIA